MSNPHLDLLSHIQANFKNSSYLGLEGTIDGASYNPQEGTVNMVVGEGYTDCFDDSYQPYEIVGTILTQQVGDQAGPWGGERAVAIPTRGGWRIMLTHGADDTGNSDAPGAPQGEHWVFHAKAATIGAENTAQWDSGWQLTNDGTTAGDGLGGAKFGYQADYSSVGTKTAFQSSYSDTNQQIVHSTPGGMSGVYDDTVQTIKHSAAVAVFSVINAATQQITHQASASTYSLIDAAEGAISHVAGKIGVGDLFDNLASAKAAVNEDLMNNVFSPLINTQVLTNFAGMANALHTVGALSSGQLTSILLLLAFSGAGHVLSEMGSFTGSALVKIAS